jgi:tetratricopeptide (TPR) repeat protein
MSNVSPAGGGGNKENNYFLCCTCCGMELRMSKNYCSYPVEEISSGLRTVFLYAAPEDIEKLPAIAERIAHPQTGTKCRVKWLNPAVPVDETDLKNELTLSQVLIVYVTKSLNERMGKPLPLPIAFMRDNNRPYFPIADVSGNLERYCELDRAIHGLIENDPDFESKLKEQLSKYVLDEETLAEIRKKGIINQIFLSYRKDDVIAAQNLMREIHNFKGFDAISIWYDRFLAAGNLYDKEILDAVDKSEAFTLVISPKITQKHNDGTDNYVVEKEYPRAHEKKKPIVPIHLPDCACNYDELKSVFKDLPELLAIEETESYLRSIFPDLPSIDTYSSERLYLLGRAYLSGFYFEQDTKKAIYLLDKATNFTDEFGLKSAVFLAEGFNWGSFSGGVDYKEELKYRLRASEISEKILGEYHVDTISSYNDIGIVYYFIGEYDKALEYYEKALEIKEAIYGEYNLSNATSYNNIGLIYYHHYGDYDKALEYYLKALSLWEDFLGKDDTNTAISYNNVGEVYNAKGDYDKALEYHFKALKIREKVFGEEDHHTATSYSDIGIVYINIGDIVKATEYLKKALKIREKVLGENHPDTAKSYNNIGNIYNNNGEFDKALTYYFKDLSISIKISGENHPETESSYINIGKTYSNQGEFDKALEYYSKALAIREKKSITNHPDSIRLYKNIGSAYSNKGNYEKALEYYIKALEIRENVSGRNHQDTAFSYSYIGEIYYSKGDYKKALEYFLEASDILERVFGKGHKYTAGIYSNIGTAYNDISDYINALKYYKKAILVYSRIFGKEDPNTKIPINNALSTFKSIGKPESEFESWLSQ